MTNGLSLEELMKEGTYPEEYAEGENWRILHGDTLKLVKAFQPGIFDAVITDPPYASGGTKQNERNRTTNQKYSSMSAANALPDFDGDNKDQRSWTHWMAEWLYDVRKACKKGAPICLFIDWRQYPSITDALQWAGWIWRGTAVWDKGNSRPQKGRFRQQAEYIVWGSNGPMPINRPDPKQYPAISCAEKLRPDETKIPKTTTNRMKIYSFRILQIEIFYLFLSKCFPLMEKRPDQNRTGWEPRPSSIRSSLAGCGTLLRAVARE